MQLTELEEQFSIPGILSFHRTDSGLIYVEAHTSTAAATLYLQGAHLTHWQPAGERPVLFLSRETELAPGKAIRGGVPIAFPWFSTDTKADRIDGKPGPSHGFARTETWTLAFAALVGGALHMTLTLAPSAASRALGFDRFRAAFELVIGMGRTLTMRLTIANEADAPLDFEEALHTYFAVGDIHQVTVSGLEATPSLDKTRGFAPTPAAGAPIRFTAETDSIYNHTAAPCVIGDPVWNRRITVAKDHSDTTVVWNPWHGLPDLGADEWPGMVCVETGNASRSPVRLAPGEMHTMQATITVEAAE